MKYNKFKPKKQMSKPLFWGLIGGGFLLLIATIILVWWLGRYIFTENTLAIILMILIGVVLGGGVAISLRIGNKK